MFYKIKQNNLIIDALDELQCVRYFPESRIVLRCGASENPQGVISSDGEYIWHVDGWEDFPENIDCETVTLEEFDDVQTYQDIMESIRAGQDYSDFEQNEEEERAEEEVLANPTPMERLETLENALAILAIMEAKGGVL